MEGVTIRKATENDLKILYEFEQGVISAERPFDPTLKNDPVKYYDLDEMLISSRIHLVVAEHNANVVACGYARIDDAEPFLKHVKHAYVGFMYTRPDYRGKKISKLVLDALADWARSKGLTEMRLDLYFGNEPAIRAYQNAGFIKHMILMRREI